MEELEVLNKRPEELSTERDQKELVRILLEAGFPLSVIRQVTFLPESQVKAIWLRYAKRRYEYDNIRDKRG